MNPKPLVAAELSWSQVHTFRLAGHHLTKRSPNQPFRRLPPKSRPEIRVRAHQLAATLGLARIEVTIA